MNKTDRLLAIVLELQGKGRQRAEDLAGTFETSRRTIYRDIQALCEAGVPVVSIPGLGYSLMEGYFLPPLHFTTDEAILLLLGCDFMGRNFDAQYRSAARSAATKIENVLPKNQRQEVRLLEEGIHFINSSPPASASIEKTLLQPLRRAILERITVRFLYYTRHPSENVSSNLRSVDPYSLVYFSNSWHLTAYCHLRQATRIFRLERMDQLELLPQTFQRPVDPGSYGSSSIREGPILVKVLFDGAVARWVREAPPFFTIAQEETADGLLITLRIRREEELLQWLLGWGAAVRVLEPASLRQRVSEEARALLCNHQDC